LIWRNADVCWIAAESDRTVSVFVDSPDTDPHPMSCYVCMEDECVHIRPFKCQHETCVDCAEKLVRYLADCPVCRMPNEIKGVLSKDLSILRVILADGTAAQMGPYYFPISSSKRRCMRLMRRKHPVRFEELLGDECYLLLLSNNILML